MYPHYVYVLKNTITGKCYVGCTKDPKSRIKNHMFAMRAGKHIVEQMNIDYAKYGKDSFVCVFLDKHEKAKALQLEAFYSVILRSKDVRYGYNYKDKKGTGTMYVIDKWRTVGHDHCGKRLQRYIRHKEIIEPEFTGNYY